MHQNNFFKVSFKNRAIWVIGSLIFQIATVFFFYYKYNYPETAPLPQAIDIVELQNQVSGKITITDQSSTSEISNQQEQKPVANIIPPTELNLKLTFYSQAPFADWSMPWQEACEEASILLVANSYFQHNWNRTEFNQQILDLVEWEKKRFGQYEHTNVEEMQAMLKEYFQLESIVHENPTLEDIKKILAQGHLIVAPFGGKILGNPNYTNGGPAYHAMVIKGYTKEGKVITHDVGTRKGEDYVYTWEKINTALHDYAEPIEQGPKRLIEVLPPSTK
ncbi:C39 family peptidase [Candidatus Peregrinibacteria bacterium]|nr:C39 family peptidase [Candidatus Peregrinibacteria bacterium]